MAGDSASRREMVKGLGLGIVSALIAAPVTAKAGYISQVLPMVRQVLLSSDFVRIF